VEEEVTRLSSPVDALLSLARADAGQLLAASVPFNLAESPGPRWIARAAERARPTVTVEASALPVVGDPLLDGHILDNLLGNGLRHVRAA
jgi:signal transduction histidine kinase